jgi:hypothetical protein
VAADREGFENHWAGRVPFHFVAAPAVARTVRRWPRDLEGAPFIVPGGSSPAYREVLELLDVWKVRPRVVAEVDDVEIARRLAVAGHGIAPLNEATINVGPKGAIENSRYPGDCPLRVGLPHHRPAQTSPSHRPTSRAGFFGDARGRRPSTLFESGRKGKIKKADKVGLGESGAFSGIAFRRSALRRPPRRLQTGGFPCRARPAAHFPPLRSAENPFDFHHPPK